MERSSRSNAQLLLKSPAGREREVWRARDAEREREGQRHRRQASECGLTAADILEMEPVSV